MLLKCVLVFHKYSHLPNSPYSNFSSQKQKNIRTHTFYLIYNNSHWSEFNNESRHSFIFLSSLSHPLTGLEGLSPPPPWESWGWCVREEWGLLSLLMCPDSAISTPLSSLRVWPLSDSWDRAPPGSKQAHTSLLLYQGYLFLLALLLVVFIHLKKISVWRFVL